MDLLNGFRCACGWFPSKLKYDLKSALFVSLPKWAMLHQINAFSLFKTRILTEKFNAILTYLFSKLVCSIFPKSSSVEKPVLQLLLLGEEWTMYYFHENSRN